MDEGKEGCRNRWIDRGMKGQENGGKKGWGDGWRDGQR